MKNTICSMLIGLIFLLTASAHATNIRLETEPNVYEGSEFKVNVVMDAVNDAYGVAFDLKYDPATVEIVDVDLTRGGVQPKVEEGDILNNGDQDATLLRAALEDDIPGTLVVGLTRSGDVSGVVSDSDAIVLSVYFAPKTLGSSKISFIRQGLKQSDMNDIAVDAWNEITFDILEYDYTGDVNHTRSIDLADIILALKVASGILGDPIHTDADVNQDGKIGVEEAIFAAQRIAGL